MKPFLHVKNELETMNVFSNFLLLTIGMNVNSHCSNNIIMKIVHSVELGSKLLPTMLQVLGEGAYWVVYRATNSKKCAERCLHRNMTLAH